MIGDDRIFSWLEHRAGLRRLAHHPAKFETRSLEQNNNGETFVAAFGQRQIRGFVGFVDLVDFSTKVAGKSPSEISNYLRPFLSGVINAARRCGALIDKTIGDEVMFLIPEMSDDGGVPAVLSMGPLLGCLCQLRSDLNPPSCISHWSFVRVPVRRSNRGRGLQRMDDCWRGCPVGKAVDSIIHCFRRGACFGIVRSVRAGSRSDKVRVNPEHNRGVLFRHNLCCPN